MVITVVILGIAGMLLTAVGIIGIAGIVVGANIVRVLAIESLINLMHRPRDMPAMGILINLMLEIMVFSGLIMTSTCSI